MQLSLSDAYAFVRSQVVDRLGAVDPVEDSARPALPAWARPANSRKI